MAKIHKVEFYLVDCDSTYDNDEIECGLESQFEDYGGISIKKIQTVDIGEWHDDHKFNLVSTPLEEYEKEFEK